MTTAQQQEKFVIKEMRGICSKITKKILEQCVKFPQNKQ